MKPNEEFQKHKNEKFSLRVEKMKHLVLKYLQNFCSMPHLRSRKELQNHFPHQGN